MSVCSTRECQIKVLIFEEQPCLGLQCLLSYYCCPNESMQKCIFFFNLLKLLTIHIFDKSRKIREYNGGRFCKSPVIKLKKNC